MVTVVSPVVVGNTFQLSLQVRSSSYDKLIIGSVGPEKNELTVMTYIGPKGTAPSGSIKGLKEGEWYEIVISQQKQLVNINSIFIK